MPLSCNFASPLRPSPPVKVRRRCLLSRLTERLPLNRGNARKRFIAGSVSRFRFGLRKASSFGLKERENRPVWINRGQDQGIAGVLKHLIHLAVQVVVESIARCSLAAKVRSVRNHAVALNLYSFVYLRTNS